MFSNNFAELLKQKRTTLNISQSQVAKLCFLSKASYNHLERGIRLPSLETLIKLSQILNTEPSEFLDAIMSDIDLSNDNTGILEESTVSYSAKQKPIERSFEQLDTLQQRAILDIMDTLICNNKKTVSED